MTRIRAILLSYFGPTAAAIVILLLLSLLGSEPTAGVDVASIILLIVSAVFIRVYFAVWYAHDKARSGALGLLALFGWLGWILLIVVEDRKNPSDESVTPPLTGTLPGAVGPQSLHAGANRIESSPDVDMSAARHLDVADDRR